MRCIEPSLIGRGQTQKRSLERSILSDNRDCNAVSHLGRVLPKANKRGRLVSNFRIIFSTILQAIAADYPLFALLTASVRLRTCSLSYMRRMWVRTVPKPMFNESAISL